VRRVPNRLRLPFQWVSKPEVDHNFLKPPGAEFRPDAISHRRRLICIDISRGQSEGELDDLVTASVAEIGSLVESRTRRVNSVSPGDLAPKPWYKALSPEGADGRLLLRRADTCFFKSAAERTAAVLPRGPGILGQMTRIMRAALRRACLPPRERQRQDSRPRLPPVEDVACTDFLQSLDHPLSFPKTLGCLVLTVRRRDD